jgi:hypothetical protein
MPVYYWEEDVCVDPVRFGPTIIAQTIEVSDDGVLVYEARDCTDCTWEDGKDTDTCGQFFPLQSKEAAIQRLQAHRECLAEELADIDAVLEAAQKARSFMGITHRGDDEP